MTTKNSELKKRAAERAKKDPRNVEVEALRAHQNSYGDTFAKKKGDKYIHPRPAGDIAGGMVKLVKSNTAVAADAPKA